MLTLSSWYDYEYPYQNDCIISLCNTYLRRTHTSTIFRKLLIIRLNSTCLLLVTNNSNKIGILHHSNRFMWMFRWVFERIYKIQTCVSYMCKFNARIICRRYYMNVSYCKHIKLKALRVSNRAEQFYEECKS